MLGIKSKESSMMSFLLMASLFASANSSKIVVTSNSLLFADPQLRVFQDQQIVQERAESAVRNLNAPPINSNYQSQELETQHIVEERIASPVRELSTLVVSPIYHNQEFQTNPLVEEGIKTPRRRMATMSVNPNYNSLYSANGSKKHSSSIRGGRQPYIIGSNSYRSYDRNNDIDMGSYGDGAIISYDRQSDGSYIKTDEIEHRRNTGSGYHSPYRFRGDMRNVMHHMGMHPGHGHMNRIGMNPYLKYNMGHGMGGPMYNMNSNMHGIGRPMHGGMGRPVHGMGGPLHGMGGPIHGMGSSINRFGMRDHRTHLGMGHMLDQQRFDGPMRRPHAGHGSRFRFPEPVDDHRDTRFQNSGSGNRFSDNDMMHTRPFSGLSPMGGFDRPYRIKK